MSRKLLQKERPNSSWNCIWCPQLTGRWSFGLFVRSQLMRVYGELGLHFRCLVKASVQVWRCIATTRLVAFLSLCLCVVCLLITSVSPAKTVEPIKMPLGCWLGSKNGPPRERALLGSYLDMPRLADILNLDSKGAAAMRPLATSTVVTCYLGISQHYYWRGVSLQMRYIL